MRESLGDCWAPIKIKNDSAKDVVDRCYDLVGADEPTMPWLDYSSQKKVVGVVCSKISFLHILVVTIL